MRSVRQGLGQDREDITSNWMSSLPSSLFTANIRPQYACRNCETITAAPISPAIIDGGMAAVGC